MRLFLKSLALVLAVALAGILGLLLWPEPELPELARDLPASFEEGQEQFRTRVAGAIAVPLPEAELIELLTEQGFSVNEGSRVASVTRGSLVCNVHWRIRWNAQAETVHEITASYGAVCL
ncbi:hypothetical protein [Ruegeria atlantica]|uniref:hypothetical protein n=1 Tax=Ruegeria atlantica TaxID=81569 RepID=UPI00147DE877|nr:hypothetical protein [Ruegeria atlantica]